MAAPARAVSTVVPLGQLTGDNSLGFSLLLWLRVFDATLGLPHAAMMEHNMRDVMLTCWSMGTPPPQLEWGVGGSAAARGITFLAGASIAFGEVVLVPMKESLRGWEEKSVEYGRKMMGVSDDECGLAEQRSLFKSLKSAHGVLRVFEGEDESEAYFRKQPRGRDCPLANGDAERFGTKGTGANIAMVGPYAATVLLLAFERHVMRVYGGNPLPVNKKEFEELGLAEAVWYFVSQEGSMCGGQCTMGLGVVLGDPGSRALTNNRGGICEVFAWFVRRNESCIFVDPPPSHMPPNDEEAKRRRLALHRR